MQINIQFISLDIFKTLLMDNENGFQMSPNCLSQNEGSLLD